MAVAAQLIHRPSNCHWLLVIDSIWLLVLHTWEDVQLDCRHQDTTPRTRPTICRPTAMLLWLYVSPHTWNTWKHSRTSTTPIREQTRLVEYLRVCSICYDLSLWPLILILQEQYFHRKTRVSVCIPHPTIRLPAHRFMGRRYKQGYFLCSYVIWVIQFDNCEKRLSHCETDNLHSLGETVGTHHIQIHSRFIAVPFRGHWPIRWHIPSKLGKYGIETNWPYSPTSPDISCKKTWNTFHDKFIIFTVLRVMSHSRF